MVVVVIFLYIHARMWFTPVCGVWICCQPCEMRAFRRDFWAFLYPGDRGRFAMTTSSPLTDCLGNLTA